MCCSDCFAAAQTPFGLAAPSRQQCSPFPRCGLAPLCLFLALSCLQGCEKSDHSSIRLTKQFQRAYLTCETLTGDQALTQDVPIVVQSVRRIDEFEEPQLDDPEVKINMPNMKVLATLIDKMKGVSDVLEIQASSAGTLILSVAQSQVSHGGRGSVHALRFVWIYLELSALDHACALSLRTFFSFSLFALLRR